MRIKIRPTDKLFSEYLRKKREYTCGSCKKHYPRGIGLSVSHFYGRRKESVRFSEINCDIFCFRCAQFFTENPALYAMWKKEKLGDTEYKKLMVESERLVKRDDALTMLWLKQITS